MSMISVKECVLLILFILISGAEGNPHHYTPSSAAPPLATHFACQSDPCLHGLCIDHSANRYIACECFSFMTTSHSLWLWWKHFRHHCAAILLYPLLWFLFDGLVYYVSTISTYLCFCEEGYTGYQCQTDWNECWSEPCLHAGTCIDEIGRYRCLCRPGFTGPFI